MLAYNNDKRMKFLCLAVVSQLFALVFVMVMFYIGDSPLMAGMVIFGSMAIATYGLVVASRVISLSNMRRWHHLLLITLGVSSSIIVFSGIVYLLRHIFGIFILFMPIAEVSGVMARAVFYALLNVPTFSIAWFLLGVLSLIAVKGVINKRI